MDEIKEKLGFDKLKSYKNIYENLSNIVIEHPELDKDVFVAFEKAFKSNAYDRQSAYRELYQTARERSELAEDVLDIYRKALEYDEYGGYTQSFAYDTLNSIVGNRPELAKDVLNTLKKALKSDKNNDYGMVHAYMALGRIVKERPELVEDVLDVLKEPFKSDKNGMDSLNQAYHVLSDIVDAKPKLAEAVLDTIKEYTESYNRNSIEYALLACIAKRRPELAESVYSIFIKVYNNDHHIERNFNSAYNALRDIVKVKPELASDLSNTIMEALQSNKNNDEGSKWGGIALKINRDNAEMLLKEQQAQSRLAQSQQQLADKIKDQGIFLEGKGIHKMSKKERQETFERSDKLRKEHPVMQEVALTAMCRCYVAEDDKKAKLGFLKTLYQIRKGGKTNKENRDMANTFARVLDKAPELKKDENLVALSKVDFVVSQPTRQVKKQVEKS